MRERPRRCDAFEVGVVLAGEPRIARSVGE
jgi:hypothetical protein